MTPPEVRFLLGRLTAAYGRRQPDPDTVAEWERALRPYPASDGHATLNRLIDQGEPGPSLPAFVAHVRAMIPPPVAVPPVATDDDGPPGEGPTERGLALMRLARERLAAAQSWQPGAEGARMGDHETSQRDTTGH